MTSQNLDRDAVTSAAIDGARERLAGVLRPTPAFFADALGRRVGADLWLKPEHLQRTGSFKIRGAYNLLSQLESGSRVVAGSAGNHAQGVALAAGLLGIEATIFMPEAASIPKVVATRDYGATVVLKGETVDEAVELARAAAKETGAHFVPPFDDPRIIIGQGTVGAELRDELPHPTTVLVCTGGGGLLAGVGTALAGTHHRVIGVEAMGAASIRSSLDAGRVVTLDAVDTIADGIALRAPSELTFEVIQETVDDVVTVTDDAIAEAVLVLLERSKAVVEPSGAVGIAALLSQVVDIPGPVATIVSGGNVDPVTLTRLVQRGLAAAGRYLRLRVIVPDRPGGLAEATAAVARVGLNVLEVEHQRVGLLLDIDEVGLDLTVETRGPDHRDQALHQLADDGWKPRVLS